MMEMCNVAGENCTRCRKGEIQPHRARRIGYKLSRELRFSWDPHRHILPCLDHYVIHPESSPLSSSLHIDPH